MRLVVRRRRRGDGTVFYDHAERVWVARVSLGTVNGKRIRRKVRAPSEAAARRELEDLQRSYHAGGTPASGTLDAYLADWLPAHARSIRESTRSSYETHIRLWISPLLGGIPLGKLAVRDVRRLVAEIERKGRSPAYTHLIIRTLSVALKAAVNDRTISDNPARGVKLPKIEREPVRPLTYDDAGRILDTVTGTWIEHPVRVWLGSGLRRGEVLGLDQRDLMLDEGFVRVRVSKTMIRAVPVTDDAIDALRGALRAAPRRGPNEPVFYSPRTGGRMRGDSITHALPRMLEGAGLGHLTPHALRHGAATMMLADGTPMRVISEQLGHRNPSLTARVYAHVIPESQRTALRSLERRRAT
jgi:integrase